MGESVQQPWLYYTHNVVGSTNLIEAMRKNGVKTVIPNLVLVLIDETEAFEL